MRPVALPALWGLPLGCFLKALGPANDAVRVGRHVAPAGREDWKDGINAARGVVAQAHDILLHLRTIDGGHFGQLDRLQRLRLVVGFNGNDLRVREFEQPNPKTSNPL